MLTRVKALLPVSGIVVALILLMVGSKEVPSVRQDFPPWVAPATGLCESINAPATLLLGGLMLLAHSLHFEQTFSRAPIPQMIFLGGVALLWFVVSIEVKQRLTKTPSTTYRLVAAGLATAVVVALVPLGIEAWRQEQAALALGCVAWSAVLTVFYGTDLARLALSGTQAG